MGPRVPSPASLVLCTAASLHLTNVVPGWCLCAVVHDDKSRQLPPSGPLDCSFFFCFRPYAMYHGFLTSRGFCARAGSQDSHV